MGRKHEARPQTSLVMSMSDWDQIQIVFTDRDEPVWVTPAHAFLTSCWASGANWSATCEKWYCWNNIAARALCHVLEPKTNGALKENTDRPQSCLVLRTIPGDVAQSEWNYLSSEWMFKSFVLKRNGWTAPAVKLPRQFTQLGEERGFSLKKNNSVSNNISMNHAVNNYQDIVTSYSLKGDLLSLTLTVLGFVCCFFLFTAQRRSMWKWNIQDFRKLQRRR